MYVFENKWNAWNDLTGTRGDVVTMATNGRNPAKKSKIGKLLVCVNKSVAALYRGLAFKMLTHPLILPLK